MKEEGRLDDEAKKEYCEKQFDHADDKKKGLERTEGKLKKAIAAAKESVVTLKKEIAALGEGIVALDKSVAEANDQRREENSDYKTLMVNNQAAKELLEFAKNLLNKFYNQLYKHLRLMPSKRQRRSSKNFGICLCRSKKIDLSRISVAMIESLCIWICVYAFYVVSFSSLRIHASESQI